MIAAAALAAPAAATAAPVAADPAAHQVTALGGTLVWTSGAGSQTLMQRSPGGMVAPVAGSGEASEYRSPDLGRDARGRLVLTYGRCTGTRCRYFRDDLRGRRSGLSTLAPKRCELSSTPAIWGRRVAFGARCLRVEDGRRVLDFERTGLYVKRGARRPRMLPAPRNAARNGATDVTDTDLRGTRVGALYKDYDQFAVIQTADGRNRRSVFAATTEDDLNNTVAGVTVGTGPTRLWYLVRVPDAEGPARSVVYRMTRGCEEYQVFTGGQGSVDRDGDVPYVDMALDAGRLHLVEQGGGIVERVFEPTGRWC